MVSLYWVGLEWTGLVWSGLGLFGVGQGCVVNVHNKLLTPCNEIFFFHLHLLCDKQVSDGATLIKTAKFSCETPQSMIFAPES